MKILGFECSARAASVAVMEDEVLVAQSFQNNGQTHSRTLLPMLESLLKNAALTLSDMDGLAVVAGPGSFTGLRIGVAAVKGLALAAGKPCCGVSTLEAMAFSLAHMDGFVLCPVMDARRSQVYNALFLAEGGAPARLCEDRAVTVEELCADLKNLKKSVVLVGDGVELCYNASLELGVDARPAPPALRFQTAAGVCMAARRGKFSAPDELQTVYLRLSQAERERLARMKRDA